MKSKKVTVYQYISMIWLNLLAVTFGFFFILALISLLLSSLSNIVHNNEAFAITSELLIGWPLIIILTLALLRFVYRTWFSKLNIKKHLYMLIPTIEAVILYGALSLLEPNDIAPGSDLNTSIAFLYVIGCFILTYIVDLIYERINNKKKISKMK
jgi:hypothetical protein